MQGTHDKVFSFIRETLLHENLVESLSVDLAAGEVRLNLLQPNPDFDQYPAPELLLTFSGVRELSARDIGTGDRHGETVLGIDCVIEYGLYRATFTVGDLGAASWSLQLVFADLRFKRSRHNI